MIAGIDKIIVKRHPRAERTTLAGVVIPDNQSTPDRGEIIGLPIATTHEVALNYGDQIVFAKGDGITIDTDTVVLHLTQILAIEEA